METVVDFLHGLHTRKKNKRKCGSWSAFQNYYFDHFVILIFSADSCIKNTIIYRG